MSTATTTTLAMHAPTIINATPFEISVPAVGAMVFVGSVVCGSVGCGVVELSDCVGFAVGSGVVGCIVGVGWVVGFWVGAVEVVGVGVLVG
jgi:hypothetical protein